MVWGVVTRAEGHMPPGRDGLFPANAMGERGEERRAAGTAPGCCQHGWEVLGPEPGFGHGALCQGSWMLKAASCCWPGP